ncbi:polymorphic toxin-type HINT domain-containing protein [Dictyobacter kobayashii]|nr:polymorphic toxin-type HINT domain-containing protein [Dictyobacter kobayashii]
MNVGKGIMWAGDQFLGVSSMINDVHTLSGNGSWQDKALAAGDLGMNAFMDISMVFGVGEELRGGELMAKGAFDLAEDGGEHLAEACGLSFSYATTVAVEGGSQSIGSLKVGQKVWAYNTQTKKMELEPIQHVIVTTDHDLVDLTISTQAPAKHLSSETIHTNKKHPFLVAGKGFVPVGQLRLGMPIVEANGQLGVVTGWKSVPGSLVMYNLTVTQDHTYAVGTNHWIVHNEGICTSDTLQKDIYRSIRGDGGLSLELADNELTPAGKIKAGSISHFEDPVDLPGTKGYGILEAGTKAPEGTVWTSKPSPNWNAVHVGLTPIDPTMSRAAFNAAVETLRPLYVIVMNGE